MSLTDKVQQILKDTAEEALTDFVHSSAASTLQQLVDTELQKLETRLQSYIDAAVAKLKPPTQ